VFARLLFTGGDGRRIRETPGLHIHFRPLLVVVVHVEFALHLVDRKKQEFADESQVGGVAGRYAVLSDGFVEFAKGEIDVRGGHEPASEGGGEFGAEAVGFDDLALGTSVENAERWMILLPQHAAGAAVGERELTERGFVGGDTGTGRFWFIHGLYSLGEVGKRDPSTAGRKGSDPPVGMTGKSGREYPPGVSDVWQAKGLRRDVFGSVAMIRLTGEISEVWQEKELGRKRLKVCRFEG
jgi:hypothetical protein